MTEASMLAPRDRHKMVLGDAYGGPFCIGTGTRWFRDGVSDRAGDALGAVLFPGRYYPDSQRYAELNKARTAILGWSNGPDSPDYYSASDALITQAEIAAGEDAISKVMGQLSKEYVPGGQGLRRAFKRGTGLEPASYLTSYALPWLGADISSAWDASNPPLVLPGSPLLVRRVYDGTPASRWKLAVGDRIVSIDGRVFLSDGELARYLAAKRPGDFINVRVERGSKVTDAKMKLIALPTDIESFEALSHYVPGSLAAATVSDR